VSFDFANFGFSFCLWLCRITAFMVCALEGIRGRWLLRLLGLLSASGYAALVPSWCVDSEEFMYMLDYGDSGFTMCLRVSASWPS
jgi:hypothetical protein